jgi:hypothetical protein
MSILLQTTSDFGFTPLNADDTIRYFVTHFALIILLAVAVIGSAMFCYYLCSYFIAFWDRMLKNADSALRSSGSNKITLP